MCDCSSHHDPEVARPGLSRRALVAGGLAAGAVPLLATKVGAQANPTFGTSTKATASGDELSGEGFDGSGDAIANDYAFLPPRPASEKYVRPIMFPVLPDATLGKATWSDTYLAPRSNGRLHEGQDLMGAKMLKLLACTDGEIVELRHQSSGNSLYLKGDDGWYYCYLHINNDDPGTDNGANQFKYAFAPGMAVGKRVLKGDHVAYLGDSGNAEATGAHCHFEIRMPNAKWYNAAAVNAKYSLDASEAAKLRPKVADAAFKPLANADAFVRQQAADFLGGLPSAAWLAKSVADLEGGALTPDAFIETLLDLPGAAGVTAPTIRLYLGYFLRVPDFGGLDYWIRKVRAGTSLDVAASQFAGGSEFLRRYGQLNNEDYLTQIYRNLFDRDPDPSGKDYWLRRLDAGMKRGTLMRQFCESSEYRRTTASRVRVIQVYAAMLRQAPDAASYATWTDLDASSANGLTVCIAYTRVDPRYAARFSG
ncbi:MAG: DUF4214 domain-containing protein [Acidimicrobiales bacterium]